MVDIKIKICLGVISIILFSFGNLLSAPKVAAATVYTVKASGGNYTTIQACLNAAGAGDTCEVYSNGSTYSGGSFASSGTSWSAPVTLKVHTGDIVTLTSSISAGTRSYLIVQGFYFNGASVTSSASASHIKIIGNTFNNSGLTGGIVGLHANYVLIDSNTFTNVSSQDNIDQWGQYWIIRDNDGQGGTETSQHPDFWQSYCAGNVLGSFTLFENNYHHDWTGGDSHFLQLNNNGCTASDVASNYILRYNRTKSIPSYFAGFQDNSSTQTMYNIAIYNNTLGQTSTGSNQMVQLDATNAFDRNDLEYQSMNAAAQIGVVFPTTATIAKLWAYYPGQTYTTRSPFSTCVISGSCTINQDPKLTNYAAGDFSLQTGSPLIGAGDPTTRVAAGDTGSGTTITVDAAYAFQDGWGGLVNPDVIQIGSHAPVSISSINYATNTIVLASDPGTRAIGDAVNLYQLTDGTRVLYSTNPDIGAVPYNSGGSNSTPIFGDINLDHIVNAIDYSILNSHWFGNDASSDLNHDGIVNAIDYSILNSNWFKTW